MQIKRNDQDAIYSIFNWNQLGAILGAKANTMAYALSARDSLQKKIQLGERTVYESAPSLKLIQTRLGRFLEPLFAQVPDNDCAIAYRKGVSPVDVIRDIPHAKVLIGFDIRHYFDNVRLEKHLVPSLVKLGFCETGARLMGRYCIVKKKDFSCLQQGSPASPVISNIVGHYYIDRQIKNWLAERWPGLNATYIRYCDNVALFVHDDLPEGFYDEYKTFVKGTLLNNGFKTHSWSKIADNNPVAHQKFLGLVLNCEIRTELEQFDRLRAMLLNWARFGIAESSRMYMEKQGVDFDYSFDCQDIWNLNFKRVIRGHINYIARVSKKQGLILKKLFAAAEYTDLLISYRFYPLQPLDNNYFTTLKKYRNNDQSLEDYMEMLKKAA